MILDRLDEAYRYERLHPLLPAAIAYLRTLTVEKIPATKTLLEGDSLFVVPFQGQGVAHVEAKLEAHKKYIDIHFLLEGEEELGWKPAACCSQCSSPFDQATDCALYADEPESWVACRPGSFVLFWPGEAHATRVSAGVLRKVIVKLVV